VPSTDDVDDWFAGFNKPLVIGDEPAEVDPAHIPGAATPLQTQNETMQRAERDEYNFTKPETPKRMRKMMME
jgi:hypothetical protein